MFRKTISLITLAALIINMMGLTGCTKLVKVPAEQVRPQKPTTVTQLKLHGGASIVWGDAGARYHYQSKLFEGTTVDGSQRQIRLLVVDTVFFTEGNSTVERSMEAESFHRFDEKRWRHAFKGIVEGYTNEEGRIKLQKNTGGIDSTCQCVVGITKSGDRVEVPLADVTTLDVRRASTAKTVLLVIVVTPVVLSLIALAAGFGSSGSMAL